MPPLTPSSTPPDRRNLLAGMAVSPCIAPDGWRLRRFACASGGSRGGLFFQAGRGDIFEKYLESLRHWHAQGWSLAGFDWRGHRGSGRIDYAAPGAQAFAPSVADLASEWRRWRADVAGPHVLAGHSMGGYLSLRAAVEGAVVPDALVLVAPMLGLRSPLGARVGEGLARWQCRRGRGGRAILPEGRRPGGRLGRMALLTHDPERFADELWWHERLPGHRLGTPNWGWLHEAFAATRTLAFDRRLAELKVPVLMLVAEHDRLVDARAALRIAERLPNVELVRFGRESAHEILRESDPVRTRAHAAIDAFLNRVAPRR